MDLSRRQVIIGLRHNSGMTELRNCGIANCRRPSVETPYARRNGRRVRTVRTHRLHPVGTETKCATMDRLPVNARTLSTADPVGSLVPDTAKWNRQCILNLSVVIGGAPGALCAAWSSSAYHLLSRAADLRHPPLFLLCCCRAHFVVCSIVHREGPIRFRDGHSPAAPQGRL